MCEDLAFGSWYRVSLVPRYKVPIARELPLGGNFASDENAWVSFAIQDPNEGRCNGGDNEKNPVDPSPANALGYKSTADRTNDRTE
jgi:hypothetical protein